MSYHKDLIVWQKSMALAKETYRATAGFPREELFGLTSQMRRAAVSIPSNIAEGYGRLSGRDTVKFLRIALGSASELETQCLLSRDLDYLRPESFDTVYQLNSEIIRMLTRLIEKLNAAIASGSDSKNS